MLCRPLRLFGKRLFGKPEGKAGSQEPRATTFKATVQTNINKQMHSLLSGGQVAAASVSGGQVRYRRDNPKHCVPLPIIDEELDALTTDNSKCQQLQMPAGLALLCVGIVLTGVVVTYAAVDMYGHGEQRAPYM